MRYLVGAIFVLVFGTAGLVTGVMWPVFVAMWRNCQRDLAKAKWAQEHLHGSDIR